MVINSVTGDPILRAHVLLQGLGETTNYSISGAGVKILGNSDSDSQDYGALTNGEGKFSIASLPPGNYFVSAERLGFVAPVNLHLDATSVVLAAGDKKQDLKLKLIPAGVIAGRILDADGEPVSNAEVTAEGARGSSQARTGEQGQYRIALYPGKYRIRATPQRPPFGAEIRTDGSREVHYAATYYPDSLARSSARAIDVEPAAQLSGIDIRLIGTPNVLVSGKVTGLSDNTRAHIQPNREEDRNFGGWPGNLVKADGTFTIANLDPGKYTLVVTADGRGQQRNLQSAPVEIEVAGDNIEHLELRMIAPFEVTGQIRFDDPQIRFPKPAPRPSGVPDNLPDDAPAPSAPRMIRLLPLHGGMWNGEANADIGADDSFALEKVPPGRYHVMLDWGQGYVRSVRTGSLETDGDVLDVSNGAVGEVVVSVSSLTCEISGTVNDASGPVANAHVVLAPENGAGSFSRSTSTKPDGTYSFTGVPPGKFKLAVTEDEMYLNFMQPGEALEDYKEVAESIELHPGDKLTKDLKRK